LGQGAEGEEDDVALKKMVQRLTQPVELQDREALTDYCAALGVTSMDEVTERARVRVGGEIRAVRIVPRAGAPALEVTVTDGRGSITAVFLGRRKIAGLSPGHRVIMEGVACPDGGRHLMYNPQFELLS
jgi:hypothetical protein